MCIAAQARSAEVVSLSREVAELMERVEAAEAAADRYEARYRTSKAELQQAQASSTQLSSVIEELSEALAHEQAAARSSQEAVEQLSSKLRAVQVQWHQVACSSAWQPPALLGTLHLFACSRGAAWYDGQACVSLLGMSVKAVAIICMSSAAAYHQQALIVHLLTLGNLAMSTQQFTTDIHGICQL